MPRALAEEAMSKERGESEAAYNTSCPLDEWPAVRTRFVLCTQDRFFPEVFMRRVVVERLGVVPDEIAAGHCVALSRPRELAELLVGDAPRRARQAWPMPELIETPTRITAAGEPPKLIEEFVGRLNTDEHRLSVAQMRSPAGWAEPGQRPEFDEFTLVLGGVLVVEHEGGTLEVTAGQAVHARPGEWVRYSSPRPEGAEYIAVCVPAFSPDAVRRDEARPGS